MRKNTQPLAVANMELLKSIEQYRLKVEGNLDKIAGSRLPVLDELVSKIVTAYPEGAQLIFVCTHNSRRSHFGQVWTQVFASYFDLDGITSFSGGTEATAFNGNAIEALKRAGLQVVSNGGENPVYEIKYSETKEHIRAWSKQYSDDSNPQKDFIAVMTCTEADEACPVVLGASARVKMTYEDPKKFDGTDQETTAYDERCLQIATELYYVLSKVSESVN